jgi:RNA polymerase sigma factor (sigma-70 family)
MKITIQKDDFQLIKATLSGDKVALNELINKHYAYTFNLCLKMLYSHQDAEDVNQEIWIKTIVNLKGFKEKSNFTTWLYRVAVNHILSMKKKSIELAISKGFDGYSENLDSIASEELNTEEKIVLSAAVEEAKISCMSGMLMCLDREQRLIYVLGDIFEINHKVGSEIFKISLANYRKKLSRARQDLFNFMNNQCSLVNKNNACTCQKKTKGFIKVGYVDPNKLVFNANFITRIHDKIIQRSDSLDDLKNHYHTKLFQDLPFEEHAINILDEIINDRQLKSILRLNTK